MPFQKGQSGNPGGKPKELKGIQELARSYCPEAVKILASIMKDGDAPPAARAMAADRILDRGYGKPPQFSTNNAGEFRKAMDMSDDELAGRIDELRGRGAGATNGTRPAPVDTSQLH